MDSHGQFLLTKNTPFWAIFSSGIAPSYRKVSLGPHRCCLRGNQSRGCWTSTTLWETTPWSLRPLPSRDCRAPFRSPKTGCFPPMTLRFLIWHVHALLLPSLEFSQPTSTQITGLIQPSFYPHVVISCKNGIVVTDRRRRHMMEMRCCEDRKDSNSVMEIPEVSIGGKTTYPLCVIYIF